MKLEHDHGSWTLHLTDHTFIDFYCEWAQLRPGYNWRTFDLIKVMYEQDAMLASHEFELILLGLALRMRINGDWETTEAGRDLLKDMEELENGTAKLVPMSGPADESEGGK